jgi:hypothetical protein
MDPDAVLRVLTLKDLEGGGQGASGMMEDKEGHRLLPGFAA